MPASSRPCDTIVLSNLHPQRNSSELELTHCRSGESMGNFVGSKKPSAVSHGTFGRSSVPFAFMLHTAVVTGPRTPCVDGALNRSWSRPERDARCEQRVALTASTTAKSNSHGMIARPKSAHRRRVYSEKATSSSASEAGR